VVLMKQRIEVAANDVQEALDQLVARGFVIKAGSHGSASYRLNRRRLEQIGSLLAKRDRESTE